MPAWLSPQQFAGACRVNVGNSRTDAVESHVRHAENDTEISSAKGRQSHRAPGDAKPQQMNDTIATREEEYDLSRGCISLP